MRKIVLYRLGLIVILSGGIVLMTMAADHRNDIATPVDLEGLKGPVHTLDDIQDTRGRTPANWI